MILSKKKMQRKMQELEEIEKAAQRLRINEETLRQCSEEGISCSYGICSECPECLENGGS